MTALQTKPVCKICFELSQRQNKLLSPCSCKGSLAFVHQNCLQKWYEADPQKGRSCSICLDELPMIYEYPLEEINYPQQIDIVCFYRPFYLFIILKFLFLNVCLIMPPEFTIVEFKAMFKGYFFLLHTSYLALGYGSQTIKNKMKYLLAWGSPSRLLFILLHIYLVYTLPITGIIGGLTENFCLFYYYHEHFEILENLNKKNRIQFLNRTVKNEKKVCSKRKRSVD